MGFLLYSVSIFNKKIDAFVNLIAFLTHDFVLHSYSNMI